MKERLAITSPSKPNQIKSNQIKSKPAISTIPMVTKTVGFRPTGLLQIVKWRCVMFSFYPAITNGIVRI
jgi:hypothetical protein